MAQMAYERHPDLTQALESAWSSLPAQSRLHTLIMECTPRLPCAPRPPRSMKESCPLWAWCSRVGQTDQPDKTSGASAPPGAKANALPQITLSSLHAQYDLALWSSPTVLVRTAPRTHKSTTQSRRPVVCALEWDPGRRLTRWIGRLASQDTSRPLPTQGVPMVPPPPDPRHPVPCRRMCMMVQQSVDSDAVCSGACAWGSFDGLPVLGDVDTVLGQGHDRLRVNMVCAMIAGSVDPTATTTPTRGAGLSSLSDASPMVGLCSAVLALWSENRGVPGAWSLWLWSEALGISSRSWQGVPPIDTITPAATWGVAPVGDFPVGFGGPPTYQPGQTFVDQDLYLVASILPMESIRRTGEGCLWIRVSVEDPVYKTTTPWSVPFPSIGHTRGHDCVVGQCTCRLLSVGLFLLARARDGLLRVAQWVYINRAQCIEYIDQIMSAGEQEAAQHVHSTRTAFQGHMKTMSTLYSRT
jgi:hypothetical protein